LADDREPGHGARSGPARGAACRASRYGAPSPRGRVVFARYRGRHRGRAGVGRRGLGVHQLRHVVARGRGIACPSVDGGGAPGRVHERGGTRRDDPLLEEPHRHVGARAVPARVAGRRPRARVGNAVHGGCSLLLGPRDRPRCASVRGARRHGGESRGRMPRRRRSRAGHARRDVPARARGPGRRLSPHARRARGAHRRPHPGRAHRGGRRAELAPQPAHGRRVRTPGGGRSRGSQRPGEPPRAGARARRPPARRGDPRRGSRQRHAERISTRPGSDAMTTTPPPPRAVARGASADYLRSRWDEAVAAALDPVARLIYRSNLLGADARITNTGGGNTSSKITAKDPVTGEPTRVLWVKGSGGDLRTATRANFASLYLDQVLSLTTVYARYAERGPKTPAEDAMVGLYPYATFDRNATAPSIDTPLHAFIPHAHVDHMHPVAVIALATAADGPALTREVYGDDVIWTDWQRPGFELGLRLHHICRDHPRAKGVILGQHGLINWADNDQKCYELTLALIRRAQ